MISPYVFVDVTNDSTLASTENFGSVAQVISVKGETKWISVQKEKLAYQF